VNTYTFLRLGRVGRLGNQLWQVAATLNRAEREGARAAIPPNWEYRPYFSLPESVYRIVPGAVEMERESEGPYYQELRHIDLVAPQLRDWFGPSERGAEELYERHERLIWLTESRHCTAIHVRRTDYLDVADRFPQLTRRYRETAAVRVPTGTTFLVFSDDIPWCRENVEELGIAGRAVEFVEGAVTPVDPEARAGVPKHDILDLWLMSRCATHVIANSSYSWWGAYLSDQQQVFYPSVWFGDPALYATMWNCIPSHWEKLAC